MLGSFHMGGSQVGRKSWETGAHPPCRGHSQAEMPDGCLAPWLAVSSSNGLRLGQGQAQQPLFLRWEATVRSEHCSSVKTRAPGAAAQGPTRRKPHRS